MRRTSIRVGPITYYLAQGHDPEALGAAIIEAAEAGAGMVSFTEVGNRKVSVLVTRGVPILFEEQDVPEDDRDDGDLEAPYSAPAGARSFTQPDGEGMN